MNHTPFKDWLLSDETLTEEHNQSLQEHLNNCAECKQTEIAWAEVESAIYRSSQVSPQPGFTSRWQTRLADYQLQKQKRTGWMSIGIISVVILSLLGFSISQVWTLLQSPGIYLVSLFSRLVSILSLYYTVQDLVHPIGFGSPLLLFVSLFFMVGMISFMIVLWLATFRKLSSVRRLT